MMISTPDNIQKIKANIDIIDYVSNFTEVKKLGGNTFRAVSNPIREEKTSSLTLYRDTQKYYDFGTDDKGDVIDFEMARSGYTKSQAIRALLHGIGEYDIVRNTPIKKEKELIEEWQLQAEWEQFKPVRHIHLEEFIPKYLLKESHKDDRDYLRSIVRLDHLNDTIVVRLDSQDHLSIIGYKRRRFKGNKWMNRKDTSPNQTPQNRVYKDDEAILIVEGISDYLTAILSGFNVIAIPFAGYSNIEAIKEIIGNDEVILFAEDKTGYDAMKRISDGIGWGEVITFSDGTNKVDFNDLSKTVEGIAALKGLIYE